MRDFQLLCLIAIPGAPAARGVGSLLHWTGPGAWQLRLVSWNWEVVEAPKRGPKWGSKVDFSAIFTSWLTWGFCHFLITCTNSTHFPSPKVAGPFVLGAFYSGRPRWARAKNKTFLYPVHASRSFLQTPTLASALYVTCLRDGGCIGVPYFQRCFVCASGIYGAVDVQRILIPKMMLKHHEWTMKDDGDVFSGELSWYFACFRNILFLQTIPTSLNKFIRLPASLTRE